MFALRSPLWVRQNHAYMKNLVKTVLVFHFLKSLMFLKFLSRISKTRLNKKIVHCVVKYGKRSSELFLYKSNWIQLNFPGWVKVKNIFILSYLSLLDLFKFVCTVNITGFSETTIHSLLILLRRLAFEDITVLLPVLLPLPHETSEAVRNNAIWILMERSCIINLYILAWQMFDFGPKSN